MQEIRQAVLWIATPFQKLIQKIHKPETVITGEFCAELMRVIQPGDILLSRQRHHIPNLFIKGFYKHAAIYVGDLSEHEHMQVVESTGKGITQEHLIRWIMTKDYVACLRPTAQAVSHTRMTGPDAVARVRHLIGRPEYDYVFQKGSKAFYCSELVDYAWQYFKVFQDFGKIIYPHEFYDQIGEYFSTVLESDREEA